MEYKAERLDLFGGGEKWSLKDWTSSDDRVRGGKSQSYLTISSSGDNANFHGTLDIQTLGGAGFASQRTTSEDREWDISGYDGIEIIVTKSDSKRYTFNIKDNLLSRDPDTGREQSTVSYEYDFVISSNATSKGEKVRLFVPWDALKATYRGREKSDAPKLNKESVKRFGIMCRSFFGEQEGDFKLGIERISAAYEVEESKAILEADAIGVKGQGLTENGAPATGQDPEKAVTVERQRRHVPFMSQKAWSKLPWILLFACTAAVVLQTCYPASATQVWNWAGGCMRNGKPMDTN